MGVPLQCSKLIGLKRFLHGLDYQFEQVDLMINWFINWLDKTIGLTHVMVIPNAYLGIGLACWQLSAASNGLDCWIQNS